MQLFTVVATAVTFSLLVVVASVEANVGPNPIKSLPGFTGTLDNMATGYLDTNDGYSSQIFYWFAEARTPTGNNSEEIPVVLWLQGGPGCSGGLGWFYENGPYNLNIDQTLTKNPYAWNTNAHFLYVDQPIGTGFSMLSPQGNSSTYPTTIGDSTTQLYNALVNWFKLHFPQYQPNPFFITGESYAGKYIPNLATMILKESASFNINLVSIAIGDGWVAPLDQTAIYGAQAFNLGIIDENDLAYVNQQFDNCTALVNEQDWTVAQAVCDNVLNWIVTTAGNINVDDVREWNDDEHDNRLEVYLSNPQVQAALFLVNPPSAYESCSTGPGNALSPDEMIPSVDLLPPLVSQLQNVYLYEGSFDMNCGVTGVERYLSKLYPNEYSVAQKSLWYSPIDQSVSGYIRPITSTLTFIIVQDAGHMVPKTQPASSFDMLTHFLTNTPFPVNSKHVDQRANLGVRAPLGGEGSRKLRLPHLHHVISPTNKPTSTFIPRATSPSTHQSTVESSLFIDESMPTQDSLYTSPLTVLTPFAAATFAAGGVIATSWTGGVSTWNLGINVYDTVTKAVVTNVISSVSNSYQQWQFGLNPALVCNRPYQIQLTESTTSTTVYSPSWTVICPPMLLLEPSVAGQLFPQGASIPIQWTGGSTDWHLQISLIDQGVGLVTTFTSSYANTQFNYVAVLPSPLDCTHTFYFYVGEVTQKDHADGQKFQVSCPVEQTGSVGSPQISLE